MQNISILYQPSSLNGLHYVRTVSMPYLKYIHFFYITFNLYTNNSQIFHWENLFLYVCLQIDSDV